MEVLGEGVMAYSLKVMRTELTNMTTGRTMVTKFSILYFNHDVKNALDAFNLISQPF